MNLEKIVNYLDDETCKKNYLYYKDISNILTFCGKYLTKSSYSENVKPNIEKKFHKTIKKEYKQKSPTKYFDLKKYNLDPRLKYYDYKFKIRDSFLYSLHYLLMKSYALSYLNQNFGDYKKYFFKKLVIDMDVHGLYKKFSLKKEVTNQELKSYLNSFTINKYTIQYICEYFKINIIVLSDEKKEYYVDTNFFKPNLLMLYKNEIYYPVYLVDKQFFSSQDEIVKKIKLQYDKKVNKANLVKKYSKMKLKELQDLCIANNIQIKNDGKRIKKSVLIEKLNLIT